MRNFSLIVSGNVHSPEEELRQTASHVQQGSAAYNIELKDIKYYTSYKDQYLRYLKGNGASNSMLSSQGIETASVNKGAVGLQGPKEDNN
jgi:hypothetical protein